MRSHPPIHVLRLQVRPSSSPFKSNNKNDKSIYVQVLGPKKWGLRAHDMSLWSQMEPVGQQMTLKVVLMQVRQYDMP